MKILVAVFAITLTLSLAACSLFGDDSSRQLGVISTDAVASNNTVEPWDPAEAETWQGGVGPGWEVFGPWLRRPLGGGFEAMGPYDHPPLLYPERVVSGESFTITILTVQGTTGYVPDGEDISMSPSGVHVTVYDRGPCATCSGGDMMSILMRDLEFSFDEPGEYELAVTGRRVYDGNWHDGGEPYTVRGVITVE